MGDPAANVPGYVWRCENCPQVNMRSYATFWLVKKFMNPAMPLPSRGKKATIYCGDCKAAQLYCTNCAAALHKVGTKAQHHSLEAIDPTKDRSILFLAPLIDFLLLPTLFLITVFTVGVPANYMSGRDVCPTTYYVRSVMYHFDSGLTFLLKDKLAMTCNLEDGYFRLLIDAWVRGIATDTDNLLLLYSAIVRSLVFHAVVIKLIVLPIFVYVNTAVSMGVYGLTRCLGYFGYSLPVQTMSLYIWNVPNASLGALLPSGLKNRLSHAAKACQKLADERYEFWDALCQPMWQRPPPTTPRVRPRLDYNDGYKYWLSRRTRMWSFCYDAAKARLAALTVVLPALAVLVRVLCITTSFDWYVRKMLLMPGAGEDSRVEAAGDALGAAIDKVLRASIPLAISHIPVAFIICYCLLYIAYRYPKFKNFLDTRNMYGAACGKSELYTATIKCRFFPKTWEPAQ